MSPFALGGGGHHRADYEGYADTVFLGTFRKQTLEALGGYDEHLPRAEDDDLNYRLTRSGGKIYISPKIQSVYYPRSRYTDVWRQYVGFGRAKAAGIRKHRAVASLTHLVPCLFVAFLLLGPLAAAAGAGAVVPVRGRAVPVSAAGPVVLTAQRRGARRGESAAVLCAYPHSPGLRLRLLGRDIPALDIGKIERVLYHERETGHAVRLLDRELLRQLQKRGWTCFFTLGYMRPQRAAVLFLRRLLHRGALRHGGFIPWDDDVDVFMPREDYEKLGRIWNEAADTSRYSYQRSSETVNTRNLFATVHDNSTTFIKTYQADMDINHGLSIDILPLDGCPASGLKRKMQKLWALTYSLFLIQKPPTNHGKAVQWLGKILLGLVPSKRLRYKIWSAAERRMTKYPISQCEYITELCSGPHYMQNRYPADCFAAAVYREFEGHMLPPAPGIRHIPENRVRGLYDAPAARKAGGAPRRLLCRFGPQLPGL